MTKLNIHILFYASGGTFNLNKEMQNAITSQTAHNRYEGSGIGSGTGTSSISNIEVNTEYPLVSFITMIAPSPDWFVGVHDFNLCNTTTGKWKESRTRDLPPYDAGTDSGPRFQSRNMVTNPPEDIHLLTNNTEGSFKSDEPVKRFGTFTFIKTYDSNPVIEPSSTMQIQPSANATHSTIVTDPKRNSTHHEDTKITLSANPNLPSTHHEDTKITLSANLNVPSQTVRPTATVTASASVQMMPTTNTTSAACSGKQVGFTHVVFAMILVNFCL